MRRNILAVAYPRTVRMFTTCLLASLLVAATCHGQVYFCNGKYTTKACDDNTKAVELKPLSRAETDAKAVEAVAERPLDSGDPPAVEGRSSGDSGSDSATGTFTRLRLQGEPVWLLDYAGSMLQVQSGEVIVKNVGRRAAQKVVVELVVPWKGSNTIRLAGPDTLEAGASSPYTLEESPAVKRGTPLHVRVKCENCWK